MNARTGELALDVAFQQFDGEPPVALIFAYNGAALPSRDRVAGWNRPTLLGFESSTTRAYAGGDAGEADADFSCRVFDAWGYPRECGSWFCAADASTTPAQYLPNITDYGRRYALRMIAGGRPAPETPYGNRDAVEAAKAGVVAAGVAANRWGVGTWTGYGEGGGPNQPPAFADCEVLQSGNTGGPISATDLDWLYADVAVFAAMGGPVVTPDPPPAAVLGENMQIVSGNNPFGVTSVLVDDGLEIRRWSTSHELAPTGIAPEALVWRGAGGRGAVTTVNLDDEAFATWLNNLAKRTAALDGGPAATLDDAQLAKLGQALAGAINVAMPSAADIAKAVNDDAAHRMQS